MCDGGGGGSDGGAADREAERQARIASGTEAVNALFGVGNQSQMVPTGEKSIGSYQRTNVTTGSDGTLQNTVETISPEEYAAISKKSSGGILDRLKALSSSGNEYKPVYNLLTESKPSTIAEAKAARDKLYTTVGDDTRKYYSSQLAEDSESAQRQLEFQKARNGTYGSSQGIDLNTEYQKRYDRGLLDVANRADTASSSMRTNDEQARLGLISKVAAGIDQGSAVSSAMSQLQSNLDNSRNEAMTGRMGNVFSDLIGGYTAGQTAAGIQQAKAQYGSALGNFYDNSSGTTNGKVS